MTLLEVESLRPRYESQSPPKIVLGTERRNNCPKGCRLISVQADRRETGDARPGEKRRRGRRTVQLKPST